MPSLNLSRAGHCHRQDTGFKVRLPKAAQLPKKADLPFLHALSRAFLPSPHATAVVPRGEVSHISRSPLERTPGDGAVGIRKEGRLHLSATAQP